MRLTKVKNIIIIIVILLIGEPGKIAQWLKGLAVFAVDLASVSSIHVRWLITTCNSNTT